jgi:hypothetical protein
MHRQGINWSAGNAVQFSLRVALGAQALAVELDIQNCGTTAALMERAAVRMRVTAKHMQQPVATRSDQTIFFSLQVGVPTRSDQERPR